MSIPKRIFFFWGNPTMSWMRYLTLKSFCILNPDWQVILYVSKCERVTKPWRDNVDQDFFSYSGPDYLSRVQELGVEVLEWSMPELLDVGASHLSNFLKWYKLQAHGGIYSDMDILWLKPFDKLFEEMSNADSAICITKYLSIGLLGSNIGNKMFKAFFDHARQTYDTKRYQCVGVEAIYDLLYNDKAYNEDGGINFTYIAKQDIIQDLRDRWPDLKIFNIPFGVIYPFGCLEMDRVWEANYQLPDHVVGIHWYAGDPLSQRWNKVLHPGNLPREDNTFTRYARRYVK